jgi:aryl-alcohol dehydrogenase-like predicted oxidoreductase
LKTRPLGGTGIAVSQLGMGCMGFAGVYGPVDEGAAIRAVHRALELGITIFDTADVYGNGTSERLLARALAGRRDAAVIATKFGNIDHFGDRPVADAFAGRWETNGRPEYVLRACDASLARLGTDHIDLYYLHRVDPDVPIEETVGAMAQLVRAGKVRAIGLSEAGAATVRRAHAVHPVAALQNEYSLWSRDAERGALDLCREIGALFVAYSPLGRGFLTGAVRALAGLSEQDWRRHQPRFAGDNLAHNLALLDALRSVAQAHDCTLAQVALAWTTARHAHVVPIPGATRPAHLEENVRSTEINLSPEEIDRLDRAFEPTKVAGDRYPEVQMRRLDL